MYTILISTGIFGFPNAHEYISSLYRQVNLTSELLKLHKMRLVGIFT